MKHVFFMLTIWMASSCTSSQSTETETVVETETEITQTENSQEIVLVNGQKWKVNEEMKPFIERSEQLVVNFVAQQNQEYRILAEQLSINNNQLFKSCTMQGQSHDELHKWLHPHLALVKDLAAAETLAQAQPIISQLQNSFAVYHQYFQ